jgi:hypothetical protein
MDLITIRKAQNLKARGFELLMKLQEVQKITNLFVRKVG